MRKRRQPPIRCEQLSLCDPPRNRPTWSDLPRSVQEELTTLLAAMLEQFADRIGEPDAGAEERHADA